MSDIKSSVVVFLVIACLIVGGVIGALAFPREIEGGGTNLTDCPTCPETNLTDCPTCLECKTSEELEKESIITGGYLIDGFFLETSVNETLSDREIYLFDDEVEFDGDDYDAEEVFTIMDLTLKANERDFEGNAYLTVLENGLSYEFRFSETLDTSAIEEEETLIFSLLGKEVELSNWEIDEITFTQGEEYLLSKGESIVFDGKTITLEFVLEEAAYVSVEGTTSDSQKIAEGTDIMKFEGIEIKAKEVIYSGYAGGYEKATLVIGTDIENTVSDGNEYEKDSIWEWAISEHSIGLVLIERFTELDEDFNALAPEEKICLPNDYVCVRYNGLIGEDTEEYTFELYEKNAVKYVRVDGNFLSGINDYDKVYINSNGIYDRDFKEINNVGLGDTELTLDISSGEDIVIGDFEVNFDLSETNVILDDVDYLTNYGILVDNPEDSVDKHEFTITVPEEQLEGIITVKQGGFEEVEEDTVEEEPEE